MSTNVRLKEDAKTVVNGHAAHHKIGTPLTAINGAEIELLSAEGLHVSEEVYWEKYYEDPDFSYEWNNGVLEVKPMSNPLQYSLYEWFVMLLRTFLEAHPIAKQMALEMAFRLAIPNRTTARRPDLFIVRNDNPIALQNLDRRYKGICDLCIESLSTSNKKAIERDTKVKKQEYAAVGVREYFILDARAVHTAFYRLTERGNYADIKPDEEGVIHSAVLPGFQFRISDLYHRPSLVALAEDAVYQGFVLPEYQAALQRAERLAAQLRALGAKTED